jgi:predicted ribosomally synthesized peptide with nif11-like leader
MSAEQVKAFLKLLEDANFRAAFEAAAPEARRALLTKAGLAIPLEKAEAALKGERELAEQELDKVAGGVIAAPPLEPPPGGENAPDHLL